MARDPLQELGPRISAEKAIRYCGENDSDTISASYYFQHETACSKKSLVSLLRHSQGATQVLDEDLHLYDGEAGIDSEPCSERWICVVIDGYHVRKHLADGRLLASHKEITHWLDSFGEWILERFLTGEHVVSLSIDAWDAAASEADIQRMRALKEKKAERALPHLRAGMPDRLKGGSPVYVQANWHFVDLRFIGTDYKQFGVDPHIERDLLLGYLASSHRVFYVGRDRDYVRVFRAMAAHAGQPVAEFISLDPEDQHQKALRAYESIALERWV